jgi:hypothetical protein
MSGKLTYWQALPCVGEIVALEGFNAQSAR